MENRAPPRSINFKRSGISWSGSVGSAWRCRRIVRTSVSVFGNWSAASKGKDLIRACRIVLDDSSLLAALMYFCFSIQWQEDDRGSARGSVPLGLIKSHPSTNLYDKGLCSLDFDNEKPISPELVALNYKNNLRIRASVFPSRFEVSWWYSSF